MTRPSEAAVPPPRPPAAKTVIDGLGALVLLVVALPWLCAIALAIVLESPGPVLCRNRSLGLSGRQFEVLRFRVTAADRPQGTGVGRFLRRFSLDELPQLINVLAGDMSLVGPRPQPLSAGADEPPLMVKPGLTGMWHVACRGRLDPDTPVGPEDYLRNWSVALDLDILWRSVRSAVQLREVRGDAAVGRAGRRGAGA